MSVQQAVGHGAAYGSTSGRNSNFCKRCGYLFGIVRTLFVVLGVFCNLSTLYQSPYNALSACLLLFQPVCKNCSWVPGSPIADDFGCFFYEFLRIKSPASYFVIRQ